MSYQKIKGTQDFYGNKSLEKRYIEQTAIDVCKKFNIGEITTPIFENTNVWKFQNEKIDGNWCRINGSMNILVLKRRQT